MDEITVITLSRARLPLLRRSIASVFSQDYPGRINHLIVIDDCPATAEYVGRVKSCSRRRVIGHYESRVAGEIPDTCGNIALIYPHIARLLNNGIRMATSRWIAFLDDDNEYEANHLSSLLSCATRNQCSAVHSFRKIYRAEGAPYLDPLFPWTRDPREAARIYEVLCSKGVWVRHSNVLRDRAGPVGLGPFRNSTILSAQDPVFLVDTSVWLLERSLLERFPVPEFFSANDIQDNTAPDDKLLKLLLENGVAIVATGLPTLRYYLGGISN